MQIVGQGWKFSSKWKINKEFINQRFSSFICTDIVEISTISLCLTINSFLQIFMYYLIHNQIINIINCKTDFAMSSTYDLKKSHKIKSSIWLLYNLFLLKVIYNEIKHHYVRTKLNALVYQQLKNITQIDTWQFPEGWLVCLKEFVEIVRYIYIINLYRWQNNILEG